MPIYYVILGIWLETALAWHDRLLIYTWRDRLQISNNSVVALRKANIEVLEKQHTLTCAIKVVMLSGVQKLYILKQKLLLFTSRFMNAFHSDTFILQSSLSLIKIHRNIYLPLL